MRAQALICSAANLESGQRRGARCGALRGRERGRRRRGPQQRLQQPEEPAGGATSGCAGLGLGFTPALTLTLILVCRWRHVGSLRGKHGLYRVHVNA